MRAEQKTTGSGETVTRMIRNSVWILSLSTVPIVQLKCLQWPEDFQAQKGMKFIPMQACILPPAQACTCLLHGIELLPLKVQLKQAINISSNLYRSAQLPPNGTESFLPARWGWKLMPESAFITAHGQRCRCPDNNTSAHCNVTKQAGWQNPNHTSLYKLR